MDGTGVECATMESRGWWQIACRYYSHSMTSRAEIHNVMVAVTIILRLRVICNCSCWHIHTVALFNFKLWADYIREIFAEFISSSVSSRSVKNLTCKRSMFHSRWNYGYIEVLKWLLASCLSPLWYKNLDINPTKLN